MAWLDDRIWAHPKIRNVPRATRWIYAAALAYASGFHTEGVLTAGQLKAIECTQKDRQLLVAAGLWEDASTDANVGAIRIHDWKDHNGKRDEKRRADRLRKRAARAKEAEMSAGQGTDSPADKPRTRKGASAGQTSDRPRARARRRPPDDGSDRVTNEGPGTTGVGNPQSEARAAAAQPAPELDAAAADELEKHLDDLAIPGRLRERARSEPARALAVARYTIANAGSGAYFRTVFTSGDWPATPASNGHATKTAYERAEILIRNVGATLEPRDLDRELDDLSITAKAERRKLHRIHDALREANAP